VWQLPLLLSPVGGDFRQQFLMQMENIRQNLEEKQFASKRILTIESSKLGQNQ
jgi:hypothetical protein